MAQTKWCQYLHPRLLKRVTPRRRLTERTQCTSCDPSVYNTCFQRDGSRHLTLLTLNGITAVDAQRVTLDKPVSLPRGVSCHLVGRGQGHAHHHQRSRGRVCILNAGCSPVDTSNGCALIVIQMLRHPGSAITWCLIDPQKSPGQRSAPHSPHHAEPLRPRRRAPTRLDGPCPLRHCRLDA